MKKLIAFILCLACMTGLAGCNQQEQRQYFFAAKEVETDDDHSAAQLETPSIYTEHETQMKIADEIEIVEAHISTPDFSYAEERAIYTGDTPGVKTSGFANTAETEITFENVAEHAGKECTIEYDRVATYLDPAECVWKVHFYTYGMSGSDQTVYLDYDGKTILIVYGE